MNIENIRAVQAHIRENPNRLDMSQFAPDNDVRRLTDAHSCGTTGCIAGWAAAMAGHTPPHVLTRRPGENWTAEHTRILFENQQALVQAAADFLGLAPEPLVFKTETSVPTNNDVVRELFFAEDADVDGIGLGVLDADDVDKALEALITTGKPVWPSVEEVLERLDA